MFSFDRSDLDLRLAAAGVVLAIVTVVAAGIWGPAGVAGVFGIALAALVRGTDPRPRTLVRFGLVGAVVTFAAFEAAGRPLESALLLGVATLLGGLAAAYGPAGPLLVLWTLVATLLGGVDGAAVAGLSFLVGTAIVWALSRAGDAGEVPDSPREDGSGGPWFALIKAVAVVGSVLVGFAWMPSAPYWMALTVLIVALSGPADVKAKAWPRTAGTLIGVGLGTLTATFLGASQWALVLAAALLLFAQLLFAKASYAIFSIFLTATVVVAAELSGGEVAQVGWTRLLATALGAGIAVLISRPFLVGDVGS